MIILRIFNRETFEVDEAVPSTNVTNKILARVIEYCKLHVEVPKAEDRTTKEDLKTFYVEFIKLFKSLCIS
uniref:SKP1 component POZ domain-containing protein n=1 Tax=Solanum lycopersicum TaxID=4081 RepID=A0A3Q7GUM4_SOLLC